MGCKIECAIVHVTRQVAVEAGASLFLSLLTSTVTHVAVGVIGESLASQSGGRVRFQNLVFDL